MDIDPPPLVDEMAISSRKRSLSPYPTSVAKRLRIVEARSKANRPEMKMRTGAMNASITTGTSNFSDIVAVTQGNDVDNRQGNEIRVWRVEIRGEVDPSLDSYLLQGHTDNGPLITDFGSNLGAFVDQEKVTQFTEWKHYRNPNGADNFKMVQHFKRGIRIFFNGTAGTDAIRNILYFGCVNHSGATRTAHVTYRIWFTDA